MNLEAFYRVLPLLIEMCERLLLPPCESFSSSKSLSREGKEAPNNNKKTQYRMATLLSKKLVIVTSNTYLFIGEISPPYNLIRVGPLLDS